MLSYCNINIYELRNVYYCTNNIGIIHKYKFNNFFSLAGSCPYNFFSHQSHQKTKQKKKHVPPHLLEVVSSKIITASP